MPGQGREIRRRIKSIKSTRQITKAMELVSAAKMRKAVANVLATRPYATLAWEMVQEIVGKTGSYRHPLLANSFRHSGADPAMAVGVIESTPHGDEVLSASGLQDDMNGDGRKSVHSNKIALILITSNRGLAGSLNANVISAAQQFVLAEKQKGKDVEIITLGKKGREACHKRGYRIVADFEKADVHEEVEELRSVIKLAMDEYLNGSYGRVMVAYTDFVSALVQRPRIRQLLPIVQDADLGAVGAHAEKTHPRPSGDPSQEGNPKVPSRGGVAQATGVQWTPRLAEGQGGFDVGDENDGYIFEPSPARVLDMLLPRLVEVQLFQAVLESDASEHSARMFAMRNASDAANDMINELTLLYNQTRQAGITQEIAEISAGRIAIER